MMAATGWGSFPFYFSSRYRQPFLHIRAIRVSALTPEHFFAFSFFLCFFCFHVSFRFQRNKQKAPQCDSMLECDSYAKVLMVNPTNVRCTAAACTDVECCVDRLTLFTLFKKGMQIMRCLALHICMRLCHAHHRLSSYTHTLICLFDVVCL